MAPVAERDRTAGRPWLRGAGLLAGDGGAGEEEEVTDRKRSGQPWISHSLGRAPFAPARTEQLVMDFRQFFLDFQDHLAPKLDTYEQAIYLYIFRHSQLLGIEEVVIG